LENGPFLIVLSRAPTSRLESGKGREPAVMASIPLLPAPSNPVPGRSPRLVPESSKDDIHHRQNMSKGLEKLRPGQGEDETLGSRRSKREPPNTRARINAAPRCSEGVDHPFLVSRCGESQPPTKAKPPANARMAPRIMASPARPPFWAGDRSPYGVGEFGPLARCVPISTKSVGRQQRRDQPLVNTMTRYSDPWFYPLIRKTERKP
jgi:hypothetical protein